jgi:hypothetical protein
MAVTEETGRRKKHLGLPLITLIYLYVTAIPASGRCQGKCPFSAWLKKSPTFTYICRHLPTYQRHELMKLTAKARQKLLALVLH